MARGRGGLVRIGRVRAFVRYIRDPSASVFGKLMLVVVAAYVVWPMDLVPDVPLVGWLDDLGAVTVAMAWLSRVLDRYRTEGLDEGGGASPPP